jgi:Helicase conserved C-terminal domain
MLTRHLGVTSPLTSASSQRLSSLRKSDNARLVLRREPTHSVLRMRALRPHVPELVILTIYAALPSDIQSRVFEPTPAGARKLVIATNVAETSLAIPGIYYVVDPGFVKQSVYDPRMGIDSLVVMLISQAQARQRSGRAGRTTPGNVIGCTPKRRTATSCRSTPILMLKAMGIEDLPNFDFMDPPPTLNAKKSLTSAARWPISRWTRSWPRCSPRLSNSSAPTRSSPSSRCPPSRPSFTALGTSTPQAQADAKKAQAPPAERAGDHLTLLATYDGWKTAAGFFGRVVRGAPSSGRNTCVAHGTCASSSSGSWNGSDTTSSVRRDVGGAASACDGRSAPASSGTRSRGIRERGVTRRPSRTRGCTSTRRARCSSGRNCSSGASITRSSSPRANTATPYSRLSRSRLSRSHHSSVKSPRTMSASPNDMLRCRRGIRVWAETSSILDDGSTLD